MPGIDRNERNARSATQANQEPKCRRRVARR
jgi:hypothetical protein